MTGIVSPDPGALLGSEADPEPPTVLRPEPGRGIRCSAGLGVTPGDRGRRERPRVSPALCLHTHLAPARTQITLIHFKPTLSQEALQQILLKPYLHNVGRPITPGPPGARGTH